MKSKFAKRSNEMTALRENSLPKIGKFVTGIGRLREKGSIEKFEKDDFQLPITKDGKVKDSGASLPASQRTDFVKYQFLNLMDHSYFNPKFKQAYKIFEKKRK